MNLQLAYELATISHAAYKPPVYVIKQAIAWGYDSCEFFDCNGTQAYVMIGTDKTVVTFRGTEPDKVQDWVTDIRRSKVKHPFGKVHSGFDAALMNVWDAITERLESNTAPLYITGHSLGGALATLAVAELIVYADKLDLLKGLYTFGQPRVGDRKFAQTFNRHFNSTYRFVHNNDVVARVPWFGYSHIGGMTYLTADGEIVRNPSAWRLTCDRLYGRWLEGRWVTDGLRDHNMMKNYLRILGNQL